jgi:hypothetical protein
MGEQMLENGKKLELTIEEGQALIAVCSNFTLPERLGSDQTYSVADRSIAGDEVRKLYRELRAHSPLMQTQERWQRFGPVNAWQEVKGEGGRIGHRLVDYTVRVSISLDEEILSAIVWCLVVSLHPASTTVGSLVTQEELLWPLAKKIDCTRVLRETIGIVPGKAQPKRWKRDGEYAEKDAEAKEKPKT